LCYIFGKIIHEGVLLSVCFFCSNQSYEKGTPFSNVLRNKFKELFILTQTILQSQFLTAF
ncbi:hypothetical protein RON43_03735, partial [Lactobacillus gasseri]|nr:hypothetical protein [Lactobacillus gasseri]MDT9611445.1 hypothetical protein [Lactobacillus gasseri]